MQELKCLPQKDVNAKVQEIWDEYLSPNAPVPVNIDSKSMNITKKNMQNRDRWTFDAAAVSGIIGYLSLAKNTHLLYFIHL